MKKALCGLCIVAVFGIACAVIVASFTPCINAAQKQGSARDNLASLFVIAVLVFGRRRQVVTCRSAQSQQFGTSVIDRPDGSAAKGGAKVDADPHAWFGVRRWLLGID